MKTSHFDHTVTVDWDKDAYDCYPYPIEDICRDAFGSPYLPIKLEVGDDHIDMTNGVWSSGLGYKPFVVDYRFKHKDDAVEFRDLLGFNRIQLKKMTGDEHGDLLDWLDRNIGQRYVDRGNSKYRKDIAVAQNWATWAVDGLEQHLCFWGKIDDSAKMELILRYG